VGSRGGFLKEPLVAEGQHAAGPALHGLGDFLLPGIISSLKKVFVFAATLSKI